MPPFSRHIDEEGILIDNVQVGAVPVSMKCTNVGTFKNVKEIGPQKIRASSKILINRAI